MASFTIMYHGSWDAGDHYTYRSDVSAITAILSINLSWEHTIFWDGPGIGGWKEDFRVGFLSVAFWNCLYVNGAMISSKLLLFS